MTALKSALSISTFAAIIAIPMLVSGAQASTTTKLLSCQGNSKQKVVDCCQRILRTEKRPNWMDSGLGSGCGGVVACKAAKPTKPIFTAAVVPSKKCAVYIPNDDRIRGSGPDAPTPPQRTPNGPGKI